MVTGTFSAANQVSQEFWAVGPFAVSIAMTGSNRVDMQTKMPSGTWVAAASEQITASGTTAIDVGGYPARCRLLCATYAASIEYAVVGEILADEISSTSTYWSLELETADIDDLLLEDSDYILQEAA